MPLLTGLIILLGAIACNANEPPVATFTGIEHPEITLTVSIVQVNPTQTEFPVPTETQIPTHIQTKSKHTPTSDVQKTLSADDCYATAGRVEDQGYTLKTFHGPVARGSIGYVIEESGKKLVYTSDLLYLVNQEDLVRQPEVLIIQAHWLNEPEINRPSLLSLQRALPMVRDWQPKEKVFLVHISDADYVPGDPANDFLKKIPPANPLKDPRTGTPYPVPQCQAEWQEVAERSFRDNDIDVPVQVAYDGLAVEI